MMVKNLKYLRIKWGSISMFYSEIYNANSYKNWVIESDDSKY